MRLLEEELRIPGPATGQHIRAVVLRPHGPASWPGIVLYSDIFQLTASTLRTARRFASAGLVVCVPEIYPHGQLAGVALPFDDAGKAAGQAGADATTTAQFDADRDAVLTYLQARPDTTGLGAVGFCLGGHLALRAALDDRVGATACFYPTGVHDGRLGADPDAGTLGQLASVRGRLMLVFGAADPHVPGPARSQIIAALDRAGLAAELHVYDAEHAFMRDEGPRHDPALTDAALAAGVAFLTRG